MLACVIHSGVDQNTILKYATCSEATYPPDIAEQAKPCLDDLQISFEDMDDCAKGVQHSLQTTVLLSGLACAALKLLPCPEPYDIWWAAAHENIVRQAVLCQRRTFCRMHS